jgi:uncharacterized protein
MTIHISKIGDKGLTINDSVQISGAQLLDEEGYFNEEVHYHIVLRREEKRIRAKGRIKTTITINCIRCLEMFDMPIDSQFDIVLFPAEMLDERNTSLDPDEMEYIFYEGDQVDIEKILVEQVNLYTPLYPLCSDSCKGVCQTCGTNLNVATCSCDKTKSDIKFLFEKVKR